VPALQRHLEKVALTRVRRSGVHDVDHVSEPERLCRGVIFEQAELVVQTLRGVGDTTLDRLGNRPAVRAHPVGQRLTRLVGALKHAGHHPA
jgi:hypothetical protein